LTLVILILFDEDPFPVARIDRISVAEAPDAIEFDRLTTSASPNSFISFCSAATCENERAIRVENKAISDSGKRAAVILREIWNIETPSSKAIAVCDGQTFRSIIER
ncbi:hypothetical protein BCh11DRAFT_07453, partial [Burkholderia sp. Ch1-1]